MERDQLYAALKTGIVLVEFTKVDGTKRTMRGTLLDSFLPQKKKESDKPARPRPENIVNLWDVDAKGWRSFDFGRLISAVPE